MKHVSYSMMFLILPLFSHGISPNTSINFNMVNQDLLICATSGDLRSYCKPNSNIISGIFPSEMQFTLKYSFPCQTGSIAFAFVTEKNVYPIIYGAKKKEIHIEGGKLYLDDLNPTASENSRLYRCQLIIDEISVDLSTNTKKILNMNLDFLNKLEISKVLAKSIQEQTDRIHAIFSEIDIGHIPTILSTVKQNIEYLILTSSNLDANTISRFNDMLLQLDLEIQLSSVTNPDQYPELILHIQNTLSTLSSASDNLIQILNDKSKNIYSSSLETIDSIKNINLDSFEFYKNEFEKIVIQYALQ